MPRLLRKITPRAVGLLDACTEGEEWFRKNFPKGLDLDDYKIGMKQIRAANVGDHEFSSSWPNWMAWAVFHHLFTHGAHNRTKAMDVIVKYNAYCKGGFCSNRKALIDAFRACRALVRLQKGWRNRDR